MQPCESKDERNDLAKYFLGQAAIAIILDESVPCNLTVCFGINIVRQNEAHESASSGLYVQTSRLLHIRRARSSYLD